MNIRINHDEELAAEARKQVIANQGYCPCYLQHTAESKCMCKDFRDKVKNGYIGECNCGLYEAVKE